MAVKDTLNETRPNRLLEVLSKDYKWENIFLAFIATLSAAFGVMIIQGQLEVKSGFPILGAYPNVFATVLLVIALLGLIVVAYPFYEPAIPELKKITWAKKNELLADIARVFMFMTVTMLAFMFFDIIIRKIYALVY